VFFLFNLNLINRISTTQALGRWLRRSARDMVWLLTGSDGR
jgi:hypothetical protein